MVEVPHVEGCNNTLLVTFDLTPDVHIHRAEGYLIETSPAKSLNTCKSKVPSMTKP